ncbi:hypothetical protein OCB01_17245 [Bacillus cereus]|nr:hypothetical protein [Bacillus cereus]
MQGIGRMTEEDLTFNLDYGTLYKNLLEAHNLARMLDEETRVEEKISAYGHVLNIVGQLHSISLEEKENAYAERKFQEGEFYFMYREGRGEDKVKYSTVDAKYKAEKDLIPFRQNEGEWIRQAKRWENARNYIQEQINILKKVQQRQHIEMSQLNMSRGRA